MFVNAKMAREAGLEIKATLGEKKVDEPCKIIQHFYHGKHQVKRIESYYGRLLMVKKRSEFCK